MKLPKYDSSKTYEQLIATIKTHPGAIDNGDNLDGYNEQIVNFALEYLLLNLNGEGNYEVFFDYIKHNGPRHLSAFED
tara:strand:- start:10500 stop:10733 length:234 start_codon:yes stop_codon:yes gene_type:complete